MPRLGDFAPAASNTAGNLIQNTRDPQLNYMWEVFISSPYRVEEYEESMILYARNASVPPRNIEPMVRNYIGKDVSTPGHSADPKNFRATFWDDRRLIGFRYFQEWMNLISDPQFGRQVKQEMLRRKITLRLKDRTDFFLGLEIELTGCYIIEMSEITLNYEEAVPFQFSLNFKYDKMIVGGVDYSVTRTPDQRESVTQAISRFIGQTF